MKRVFLALPLEPVEPAAEKMKILQKLLSAFRIKWVRIENYHLTLFFFGEIPVQLIPDIQQILRSTLENSSPFSLALSGPGIFKKGKEPRVLWLGVEPSDQMLELKKEIDKAVVSIGFIPDDKPFRPHLTLGRFMQRQEVTTVLENALNLPQLAKPIGYDVSKLILFESKLFPEGPLYLPIDIFPLKI